MCLANLKKKKKTRREERGAVADKNKKREESCGWPPGRSFREVLERRGCLLCPAWGCRPSSPPSPGILHTGGWMYTHNTCACMHTHTHTPHTCMNAHTHTYTHTFPVSTKTPQEMQVCSQIIQKRCLKNCRKIFHFQTASGKSKTPRALDAGWRPISVENPDTLPLPLLSPVLSISTYTVPHILLFLIFFIKHALGA